VVHFWKKTTIEIRYKPKSHFNKWEWWFSSFYNDNDKTKTFFFTVIGLHFFYMEKKRAMEKFIEQTESVMFKVGK